MEDVIRCNVHVEGVLPENSYIKTQGFSRLCQFMRCEAGQTRSEHQEDHTSVFEEDMKIESIRALHERNRCHTKELSTGQCQVQLSLEFSLVLPSVPRHPEYHIGQKSCGR